MTMHRMVWQSRATHTVSVVDEWPEPVLVKVRPVITNYWFGTTVGFFYRAGDSFGHWYSSNVTDVITAWRVAQILPRVKTLREGERGYNSTLCGLVIAMQGDCAEKRMFERARDLDMTVEELEMELVRLNSLWPDERTLCAMWDNLSEREHERVVGRIRCGIEDGDIGSSDELLARIELCELRLRTAEEQKEYEDRLIEAGLKPEHSLRSFLFDIGVTNLVYTIFDDFAPSHFETDKLDAEIMRELIGERGFRESISLITTVKESDDPSAHYSYGAPGMQVFWSDFGESGHPRVILAGEVKDLVSASWDRATERFLLTVRPLGREHDDRDIKMSIQDLRRQIGVDMGLDGPLPAGQLASWCVIENGTKPGLVSRLFNR